MATLACNPLKPWSASPDPIPSTMVEMEWTAHLGRATARLMYTGATLMILGVAGLGLRTVFPVVPTGISTGLVVLGAVFAFLPIFLIRMLTEEITSRYAWAIILTSISVLLAFYGPAIIDNWRKLHRRSQP